MASHPPPLPSPSPSPSISKAPRRVPPPCWTHEETLALIESYHDKWYSLRRGNLKASHWQDVADAVARRCRFATPTKTSVQCRHKIEKLRKRYRAEKQRAANSIAPNRFSSSWNFFRKMDEMERGPLALAVEPIESDDDNDDEDDQQGEEDEENDEDDKHTPIVSNVHHQFNYQRMVANGSNRGGGAFRFRIPGGTRSVPSPMLPLKQNLNNYGRFDESPNFKPHLNSNSSPNYKFFNSSVPRSSSGSGRGDGVRSGSGSGVKRDMDSVADMVSSIRMLGEGFVRMEQKKIEMAKEMEQMRMDMEMKRTQMILESQQRIVEAFASEMQGKKKMKRMPSPDS